jgi:signal transduction histidine kinase/ligand-binding sensor domain-containing protein/DNA-binding response OmpR family regulator
VRIPGSKSFFLFLFLGCSFSVRAVGQPIEFRSLKVQDGLSCSYINAIVQDHEGFIWIGTFDGLNRFDGYGFTVYRNRKGDRGSLSANAVNDLFIDRRNRLWIGTQSGLELYDRMNDRFIHYQAVNRPQIDINKIAEMTDGTLVLVSSAGLYRVAADDTACTPFLEDLFDGRRLKSDNLRCVLVDRKDGLWIGTTNAGLYRIDPATGRITVTAVGLPGGRRAQSLSVLSLLEMDGGILWAGTDGGLFRLDTRSGRVGRFRHDPGNPSGLSSDICWSLFRNDRTTLWVATQEGLNLFDPAAGKSLRLRHDDRVENSLNSDNLRAVCKDGQGILWVGGTEGLNASRLNPNAFRTFRSRGSDPGGNTLSHNSVTGFSADNRGNLWIGTDGGGLNYFDRKNRRFRHYRADPSNPAGLHANAVMSVLSTGDGSVWIGGFSGGLSLFRPESGSFTQFPLGHGSQIQDDVRDIIQDRRGRLWVATNGQGLNLLTDRNRRTFRQYKRDPLNPSGSLVNDYCLRIAEDHEGALWIGTYSGLSRFDPDRDSFTNFTFDPRNPGSLSHNWVYSILEDSRQRLWIGTYGGLNLFDRRTGTFTAFGSQDGFPSNVINGILEDNRGRLWISTNAGLVQFDPETRTTLRFTFQDGLQGDEFIHGSCLRLPGGELAFGGTNGFTIFRPDSIRSLRSMPILMFTKLLLYEQKTRSERVTGPVEKAICDSNAAVTLSHNQAKMFAVSFTALEYLQPGKIRYKYKLDGYQNEWINAGTGRTATFTNLGAGRYRFRVTSTNSAGVWNPAEIRLPIRILPPFWKSPWAYAVYLLGLAGSFLAYHRYSMKLVRLKTDLKEQKLEKEKALELESLKSRFFANISHEFRTPLTLILVPLREILLHGHGKDWAFLKTEFQLMQRSAERLLRLVNQVIDFNRIDAGRLTLDRKEIDAVPFCRNIADTFGLLAADKHITLKFGGNQPHLYGWFDPDKLDMIVFNLLSNAFKFTPRQGEISLTVRGLEDGQIEIAIQDTGPGVPAEHIDQLFNRFYRIEHPSAQAREGSGIGLSLTKELTELHGGSIGVQCPAEGGARFTVKLPRGSETIHPDRTTDQAWMASSEESAEKFESADAEDVASDKEILLIIDDDRDMRLFLKQEFQDHFRVIQAKDGAEGLKKARQAVPDCIISDVMMNEMDGMELCRALKKDEATSHIPIILLTARTGEECELEGLETGADDYVSKPFHMQTLKARVRNLLESRKLLRERFGLEIRLEPGDIAVSPVDGQFLKQAVETIEKHMADPEFGVDKFGREIGLSRSQLFRKFKSLVSDTPVDFIQSIRLKRASQLLEKTDMTVTEISYEVGFKYPSHFSQLFHARFGKSPKEYRRHRESSG